MTMMTTMTQRRAPRLSLLLIVLVVQTALCIDGIQNVIAPSSESPSSPPTASPSSLPSTTPFAASSSPSFTPTRTPVPSSTPTTAAPTGRDGNGYNVLVITADQLRFDALQYMQKRLPYYKKKLKVRTPNIDRLAAQGVTFTNAYAQGSSCAPSRATIRSGCTLARHGVSGNQQLYTYEVRAVAIKYEEPGERAMYRRLTRACLS